MLIRWRALPHAEYLLISLRARGNGCGPGRPGHTQQRKQIHQPGRNSSQIDLRQPPRGGTRHCNFPSGEDFFRARSKCAERKAGRDRQRRIQQTPSQTIGVPFAMRSPRAWCERTLSERDLTPAAPPPADDGRLRSRSAGHAQEGAHAGTGRPALALADWQGQLDKSSQRSCSGPIAATSFWQASRASIKQGSAARAKTPALQRLRSR